MTPIEQLQLAVAALQRIVRPMWHGQLELSAESRGRTAHEILDEIIVTAIRGAAEICGEPDPEVDAPFVYGWVPRAEFDEATSRVVEVALVASAAGMDIGPVVDRMLGLGQELALALGVEWLLAASQHQ